MKVNIKQSYQVKCLQHREGIAYGEGVGRKGEVEIGSLEMKIVQYIQALMKQVNPIDLTSKHERYKKH